MPKKTKKNETQKTLEKMIAKGKNGKAIEVPVPKSLSKTKILSDKFTKRRGFVCNG